MMIYIFIILVMNNVKLILGINYFQGLIEAKLRVKHDQNIPEL